MVTLMLTAAVAVMSIGEPTMNPDGTYVTNAWVEIEALIGTTVIAISLLAWGASGVFGIGWVVIQFLSQA